MCTTPKSLFNVHEKVIEKIGNSSLPLVYFAEDFSKSFSVETLQFLETCLIRRHSFLHVRFQYLKFKNAFTLQLMYAVWEIQILVKWGFGKSATKGRRVQIPWRRG